MRLSILGLVSLLAGAFAAPAFSNPASISGSNTFITPAGFTSTVSGESVLPSGFFFNTVGATLNPATVTPTNASATITNGAVYVVPAYNLLGFSVATTSLSVGSSVASSASTTVIPFSSAAAAVLTNSAGALATLGSPTNGRANAAGTYFSANIDFISAIIKAGAGVNGLD